MYLDKKLSKIKSVIVKKRKEYLKEVFHLFEFRVKDKKIRSKLIKFLQKKGIDAKIHYPIPMHLQPAAKIFGYRKGDFPVTEKISSTTISLPVHEFIKKEDLNFMIKTIKGFFNES